MNLVVIALHKHLDAAAADVVVNGQLLVHESPRSGGVVSRGVPVAREDPLGRKEAGDADGAAGVDAAGRDADLSTCDEKIVLGHFYVKVAVSYMIRRVCT